MLVSPRGTGLTAEPVSAIWSEMMKCCVQPLSAVPTLSIADFMLVDSAFVYGRVEPEVLEDAVPLLRARFTLGFSESGVDVLAYKNLFESVWTASVSLQRLGDEIWPAEHKVPSPGHASAELAREALMSLSEQEVTKFRSLVENASVDITDFLDAAERDVRYQSFFLSDDSPLGKMFLAKMRAAVGPCFAIDQADLKKDNGDDRRFCEKWRKNEAYSAWSAAFAAKKGQLRRRIFVLRDWNLADEPQLVAFLMDEVDQKGVEVGLVLQSELKRFAESTRGLDAAVHDAEWIVVDAHAASGRPEVGPQTMGVSFGPAKIEADINSKSAVKVGKEDLKCKRLMDTYLKWHERIWQDPEIDLERLTDASQVQAFIRTLPSRLSEASPSEHRVGANPS